MLIKSSTKSIFREFIKRLSPQAISDPGEIPMTTAIACSLHHPQHKHSLSDLMLRY